MRLSASGRRIRRWQRHERTHVQFHASGLAQEIALCGSLRYVQRNETIWMIVCNFVSNQAGDLQQVSQMSIWGHHPGLAAFDLVARRLK